MWMILKFMLFWLKTLAFLTFAKLTWPKFPYSERGPRFKHKAISLRLEDELEGQVELQSVEMERKVESELPSHAPTRMPGGHSMCKSRTEGLLDFSFSQRTFTTSYDPYQRADRINFISWVLPAQLFPRELHSPNFQAIIQNSKYPLRKGTLR